MAKLHFQGITLLLNLEAAANPNNPEDTGLPQASALLSRAYSHTLTCLGNHFIQQKDAKKAEVYGKLLEKQKQAYSSLRTVLVNQC